MTDNHQEKPDMLDAAVQSLREMPIPDGPSPELVASTLEALHSSQPTPDEIRLQERKARMFRIARYSSLIAATVALATVLGWLTFTENSTNLAFGDVIQNVKAAKSVQLVSKQKFGKQPEMEFNWYIQGDHIRMEIPDQMIVVTNLKKKQSVMFYPSRKIAYQSTVPKDAAKSFNNIFHQLRNLRSDGVKRRGDKKVNGQNALVYELEKIDFLGIKGKGLMTIWVDPRTKLPIMVRIAANTQRGAKDTDRPFDTTLTFKKFEWNKKFDPKIFSLEVPKDYTVKKGPLGLNN